MIDDTRDRHKKKGTNVAYQVEVQTTIDFRLLDRQVIQEFY